MNLASKTCVVPLPKGTLELSGPLVAELAAQTPEWRVEDHRFHSGSVSPVVGHGMVFTATGLARGEMWAVRLGGEGVVTDTHVVWKEKSHVPNRPSPVLAGDLLFMVHQDSGMATCLEAKTGALVWRERLPGVGNHSASPLHAEGRLYFFNENAEFIAANACNKVNFTTCMYQTLCNGLKKQIARIMPKTVVNALEIV